MDIYANLLTIIKAELKFLSKSGSLPSDLDLTGVLVEPSKNPDHGDVSTNVAMILAKPAGKTPRDVANLFVQRLENCKEMECIEVAGPGFINISFNKTFWHRTLLSIMEAGETYGLKDIGSGKMINVEFVSANPTGPLHVGHARGTVFGDVLSTLLEYMGYSVTREYYVNDAGSQVDILARSAHKRYLEALGVNIEQSDFQDGYPGHYLIPVGQKLACQFGNKYVDLPEQKWLGIFREITVATMLDSIREDLNVLGVKHDIFSSESSLVENGLVRSTFEDLESRGLIYEGILDAPKGKEPLTDWEERSQSLFKSTDYGDEIDRPLKKADGSWTYFATDIAYHFDKFKRGYENMIDVWGADHAGYVRRIKASVRALTEDVASLDIKLCQMVKLTENGKPVNMSKRSGQFITLRDVVDAVGKDVVRFIMLTRKNDAPLEFDLAKVVEQSKDNPVFYVQYAHARISSVLRRANEEFPDLISGTDGSIFSNLNCLNDADEINLIKQLANWPRTLEAAARAHEPHRIAFFLQELASTFHSLWNKGNLEPSLKFIIPDDNEVTRARLNLIQATGSIISTGLDIFSVKALEEM